MKYFEVKAVRTAINDDNAYTDVKELYLVAAETYTDVEVRFAEYMARWHAGESYVIKKIQISRVQTTLVRGVEERHHALEDGDEAQPLFRLKCVGYYRPDGSRREKKFSAIGLVERATPEEALQCAADIMNETGYDYCRQEPVCLDRTQFVNVIE